MSVDAKLFVTTGKDNYVDVVNAVVKHLNKYLRSKLDTYWQEQTDAVSRMEFLWSEVYESQAKLFTNGVSLEGYSLDCMSVGFGCGDDTPRSLKILPECSCDYDDIYEGDKINFSIGCWGSSDDIMKEVAKAVSSFGEVYYDHNDSDDEDFIKLGG